MSWVALVLLGGVVALDATSLGQLMLSRPFVAATLAGAIVGMPLEGALVGALLDVLSLSVLPVGAARYPDTGTATVAAVGTLGLSGVPATPEALLLVTVYAILWQRLAGEAAIGGRYLNERLVRAGRSAPPARLDRLIELRHIESMLLDMARGVVITVVALVIGTLLLPVALRSWELPPPAATVAACAAGAAVLAGTSRLFTESRRARLFLVLGLVFGSMLVVAR